MGRRTLSERLTMARRTASICLFAGLLALLSALAFSPAAHARRIPCVLGEKKGPKCLVWKAKVRLGDDGDTVKARIKKGRYFGPRELIRLTGIQAMELFNYSRKSRRGACMAVPATVALEKMVKRSTVRLLAQKASSRSIGDRRARLRRAIQVKRGGRWIDPAAELVKRGLVLPFSNGQEWAWNGPYRRLAQEAAAKGIGIWNPTSCGRPGPWQSNPLTLKVGVGDGPGKDKASGEWMRITNLGETPVPLRGWSIRDAHLRGDKHKPGYKFPGKRRDPAERVGQGRGGQGQEHRHHPLLGLAPEGDDLRERFERQEAGGRRGVPLRPAR